LIRHLSTPSSSAVTSVRRPAETECRGGKCHAEPQREI
jgi:hypothetical protein